MSACAHPRCANESSEEHIGRSAAAVLLGDDALERVCENERPGPVVDYRSTKTAVEVKAVKHGQFEQLRATYTKRLKTMSFCRFPASARRGS